MARNNSNATPDQNTGPDVRAILMAQIESDKESIAPIVAQIEETQERIRRAEQALRALDGDLTRPAPARTPARSTGGTGSRAPRGQNKLAILKVVQERPGVSAGEVAQVTGLANPTVATSLAKMSEAGDVDKRKDGGRVTFKITEQGTAALSELEAKVSA